MNESDITKIRENLRNILGSGESLYFLIKYVLDNPKCKDKEMYDNFINQQISKEERELIELEIRFNEEHKESQQTSSNSSLT